MMVVMAVMVVMASGDCDGGCGDGDGVSDLHPRARRKALYYYWCTLVHHGAVPASLGGVPTPRPNALGVYCVLAHVLRLRTRKKTPRTP